MYLDEEVEMNYLFFFSVLPKTIKMENASPNIASKILNSFTKAGIGKIPWLRVLYCLVFLIFFSTDFQLRQFLASLSQELAYL